MSRVPRACELDEGLTLVRYPHTGHSYANPSHTKGVPVVSSPLRQNDVDNEVRHRISTLYSAASEVHPAQRSTDAPAGLVTRTRWSLGRRLVSIGESVSGSQPTHA